MEIFIEAWEQGTGVYRVCMALGFMEPWPCTRTALIVVGPDVLWQAALVVFLISLSVTSVAWAAQGRPDLLERMRR